jgi:hypothetical protein
MENELRRAVDALPGLVWTARADGHIDFLNQRWCEYTGRGVDEAYGEGWQTAIHPEDLPGLLERWRSILASDEPDEMEVRLRRFDGGIGGPLPYLSVSRRIRTDCQMVRNERIKRTAHRGLLMRGRLRRRTSNIRSPSRPGSCLNSATKTYSCVHARRSPDMRVIARPGLAAVSIRFRRSLSDAVSARRSALTYSTSAAGLPFRLGRCPMRFPCAC